ncbi:MAG: GNAT family N-acetyltransferase [Lachnospiraceae bacterium]|nr:GNAT family N-acetyltransferase [Lachnospiraceae bacterium]
MEYTRVGENNIKYFSPFIFDSYPAESKEVLRVGALSDGKLCGAFSIGFDVGFDSAILESVYVLPAFRKQGIGSDMIAFAEHLVRGEVSCMEAEYEDEKDVPGINELFDKAGYLRLPGNPMYEYSVSEILTNKRFLEIMKKTEKGIRVLSFEEMTHGQINMAFDLLEKGGERQNENNSRRFSHKLSTAVFSEDGKIIASLTADTNKKKKEIRIDYLVSDGGADYRYILGAIKGFAKGVVEAGGAENFEKLYFTVANPAIVEFVDKLFGEDQKEVKTETFRVIKVLE